MPRGTLAQWTFVGLVVLLLTPWAQSGSVMSLHPGFVGLMTFVGILATARGVAYLLDR